MCDLGRVLQWRRTALLGMRDVSRIDTGQYNYENHSVKKYRCLQANWRDRNIRADSATFK